MNRIQMTQLLIDVNTDHLLSSKIMLDMMENGLKDKISELEKENRFGQTVPCTKAGGRITKPTAWEDSSTPMVTFMMEIGLMTRHTDLECIAILMELNTKASGKKTNSMAMVLKHGQMVPNMKDNMSKVRSTELEDSHGLMEVLSMESL